MRLQAYGLLAFSLLLHLFSSLLAIVLLVLSLLSSLLTSLHRSQSALDM